MTDKIAIKADIACAQDKEETANNSDNEHA